MEVVGLLDDWIGILGVIEVEREIRGREGSEGKGCTYVTWSRAICILSRK